MIRAAAGLLVAATALAAGPARADDAPQLGRYVPSYRAQAIGPDGRASAPLRVEFDISLEKVESMHTLQRQFDPAVPEKCEGRRKVGR